MSHINPGLIRANGDIEENIFVFANSLETIANGGAGEDYYLYLPGQQAQVTISDYSRSNRLYFGADITITATSISRSQLHISFADTDDMLHLRNFSSYRFFISNDQDGLSHIQFIERANRGFTVDNPSPIPKPPDSPLTPTLERTVEIRANGTIDSDTFSLGYDLRAELNGGAGRDTFAITPYQTDDVLIRDFSVGNLIHFESGTEISGLSMDRGTFNVSLENGATVSVIIGSLQNYQLEEGAVTDIDGFIAALVPEVTLTNQVTTLVENADTSDPTKVADVTIVSYRDLVLGGIELSGADGGLFEFNQARTELFLRADTTLDFETNSSLDVTVSSILYPSISFGSLQISVTDVVAAMITTGQSFEISETASNGAVVGTVVTSGGINSLTFNITAGSRINSGVFAIDNSGVITVANSSTLDFETTPRYMQVVTVSDGTTDSTQTVTVSITDANDPPVLNNASFIVPSNARNGNVVGTVIATDVDLPANTLSYGITTGGSAPGDLFAINLSGVITIANHNNLGNVSREFTLNIEVDDGAGGIDTATITVEVRVPIPVAVIKDIQNNNDPNGFIITGAGAFDSSGWSVSGGGDVNGDGLADVIIGAPLANRHGFNSGSSYVVFGKTNGQQLHLGDVDNNNNLGGFVIHGANGKLLVDSTGGDDQSGRSVSGAGDTDGDGLDDFIVGAHRADANNRDDSGASYLVFGKTSGSVLEVRDIDNNNNDNGFVLEGDIRADYSGYSVSGAGDVNGDGLDDIIIGAPQADPNGTRSGSSYVVFGRRGGAVVDLSTTADNNNNAGFVLHGVSEDDRSGRSVSGAGDINGDGLDDIIIGAYLANPNGSNSGSSYVVFGKTDGRVVQLRDIDNDNNPGGFVLHGVNANDHSGRSVSGAGDVNGDGLDDIIVGARLVNGERGASYVIFGKTDGRLVQLRDIDNDNNPGGFVVNGVDGGDQSGRSVSGAGDTNGDGLDDIIIGANRADPNSSESGASYVIFGKTDGRAIELRDIEGGALDGFVIEGGNILDHSGYSVSGAGDVNGDGFDDVIVGAPYANPNGLNDSGASYVIFGGQGVSDSAITAPTSTGFVNLWTGDSMANQIIAGAGNNVIFGNGGADVLRGGPGDDALAINDSMFASIDGGFGTDRLVIASNPSNQLIRLTLDLTSIPNNRLKSIEIIDLNNTASTLILATDDILSIVGNSAQNTLRINGGSTDTIDLRQVPFSDSEGTQTIASVNYRIYQPDNSLRLDSSVRLLVDTDIRLATTVLELTALQMSGNNEGFVINGVDGGDRSGIAVSGAGDVNGDGFDDVIIGAHNAESVSDTNDNRGASYVVFGKTDGNGVQLSTIGDAGNNDGFVLNGVAAGDISGFSVNEAGDVNGDGLDDIIIGAHEVNGSSGASYVVFGKTSGAVVELSTIDNADDSNGFVINGVTADDQSGFPVGGGGDINGDGLDDLIIGAGGVNGDSGASYVVFGKTSGAIVELSTIDDADNNAGFVLNGVARGDNSSRSVSVVGDVNGDGLDDILIGANRVDGVNGFDSGASYVVFGKSNGSAVELSMIDDNNNNAGFVINGVSVDDLSGNSVSGAGDVNGDGLDDVIVGAQGVNDSRGASYVVFGKFDGNAVELSDIDDAGFVINGVDRGDQSGYSVSGAGDINGDGLDDILIGAYGASTNSNNGSGVSYLVFGKTNGNGVELSDVENDADGGFAINGVNAFDNSGVSVSGAGDVNGDGFDDLLVGASRADPNSADSGASYVIFGGQGVSDSAIRGTANAEILTGNSAANQIIGGAGDDILVGGGGADVLRGGAGNDVLAISDTGFAVIDGGLGTDTLRLDSTMTLGLTIIPNNRLNSIEIIDLSRNSTASTLVLATDDILSIVGSSAENTLRIDGGSTDLLYIGEVFSDSGETQNINGTDYRIYQAADSLGLDDSVTLLVDRHVSVQIAIPAVKLADIQVDGFVINGVSEGDGSGRSVSGAGDINGDGLDDIIIGARNADPNGNNSGASYVVFGKSDGAIVELSTIASADADVNNNAGFVLNGVNGGVGFLGGDWSGVSVSGAGDVNGDGLDDIIVGAFLADPNGSGSGASYVVFGKTSGAIVELSTIDDTNNNDGFVLNGVSRNDNSGFSVSGAGDVNGDGLDDLIIGAFQADGADGDNSGASYVVFGKSDGSIVELSAIADTNNHAGFVLNGVSESDVSGRSVSGAGDINGDGLDDIIIGAFQADGTDGDDSGASYVVFGKADGSIVELSAIADTNNDAGFVLNGAGAGDRSGHSVTRAGDVNGDGLDDIIVGAYNADPNGENSGASYVLFGKSDGSVVELSSIADDAGFVIKGVDAGDQSGRSVSGGGDVNGDGLDDLIIGVYKADPNGDRSGSSYLVFGKSDGNDVELSLVELGIDAGFVINGAIDRDSSGRSVSAAGDVNGDGFDDLLVGADQADPNGSQSGASYVIFGGQGVSDSAIRGTANAEILTGDEMANQIIGGAGDDTLVGGGGADVLRGGAGDDVLAIGDDDFAVINGGLGNDTLRFDAPISLDLSVLRDPNVQSIETIDLANDGGASTLSLGLADVLAISSQTTLTNPFTILGASGDRVNLSDAPPNGIAGTWSMTNDAANDTYSYTATAGSAVLANIFIDSDISIDIA